MTTDQPSITCPRCGKTSYNANDIKELYCGFCHWWTSDRLLGSLYSEAYAPEPEPAKHGPMVGARRWIQRGGLRLGGSKRKTKRRDQRTL